MGSRSGARPSGHALPLPHSPHAEIRALGCGRYSHWDGKLRFSSTDNSDPRRNGRTYRIDYAQALPFAHAPAAPERERGHCFVLRRLPSHWESDADTGSRVILLEDGRPLGPAHANHDEIRTVGGGRFSHWGDVLYFSTSDNSAPESNGRSYTVVLDS